MGIRVLGDTMVKNHMVTFPSAATLDTLSQILGAAPVELIPSEAWHVTLFVAKDPIPDNLIQPQSIYRVTPETVDFWYDSALGTTNLVIVFSSADIEARHYELKKYGCKSEYDTFVPHMTLLKGATTARVYKQFSNSLAMSVRGLPEPLTFGGEAVLDSDGYTPNKDGAKHYSQKYL